MEETHADQVAPTSLKRSRQSRVLHMKFEELLGRVYHGLHESWYRLSRKDPCIINVGFMYHGLSYFRKVASFSVEDIERARPLERELICTPARLLYTPYAGVVGGTVLTQSCALP